MAVLSVSVQELLVVSAALQALAAAAVAIFTWRLVHFTRDYVEQMKIANDLQTVANAQQRASNVREEAASAPNVIATPRGGSFSGDHGDVRWAVRNIGGSVASSIVLHTPVGEAPIPTPIGPGETATVEVRVPRDALPVGDAVPQVDEIEFSDSGGTRWRQRSGELPHRDG